MEGEAGLVLSTWGPIIALVAVFYFLLYRPQKQEQKRRKAMLDSLGIGDRVVTIGGIYGTITNVQEKQVRLQIAEGVEIEVARAAINGNITKDGSRDDA